ncbi:MAG: hydroxymethylbilane synthase [Acidobacteria bacterium]|nr:hydroxymethylbilane synthase [Acidobacteriota bacterium]
MTRRIAIGTRGSKLALWQANAVRDELSRITDARLEIVPIKTTGDRFSGVPAEQLGKGVFVKEIEDALRSGEIDLAVHSMKDLPSTLPQGLTIAAVRARDDVRDALIARGGLLLKALPAGSRVGTGSPRRRAQLSAHRPDLAILDLRGNVDTRLRKLRDGDFEAIVLAKAGLDRLGWTDQITEALSPEIMLPAVGQGALGLEAREDDFELKRLLGLLDHEPTRAAVTAERALMETLQGGCQVPIGALGRVDGESLVLEGCVLTPDGSRTVRDRLAGPAIQAAMIGAELGLHLLSRGADVILGKAGLRPGRNG